MQLKHFCLNLIGWLLSNPRAVSLSPALSCNCWATRSRQTNSNIYFTETPKPFTAVVFCDLHFIILTNLIFVHLQCVLLLNSLEVSRSWWNFLQQLESNFSSTISVMKDSLFFGLCKCLIYFVSFSSPTNNPMISLHWFYMFIHLFLHFKKQHLNTGMIEKRGQVSNTVPVLSLVRLDRWLAGGMCPWQEHFGTGLLWHS